MSVARCDVNEFDCLWYLLEMSESCWNVHVAWCHILSVFVAGGELRTMTKTFWENLKNFLSSSNFRDALENRSSCFQSLHMKMSSEKFFFLIRTEILKNLYDFSPRHVAWVVWREIHSFVSRKKKRSIFAGRIYDNVDDGRGSTVNSLFLGWNGYANIYRCNINFP